jgi:hypothetical protein
VSKSRDHKGEKGPTSQDLKTGGGAESHIYVGIPPNSYVNVSYVALRQYKYFPLNSVLFSMRLPLKSGSASRNLAEVDPNQLG